MGNIGNIVSFRNVSKEEAAELLKLEPGIYQTKDRIRSVTIEDGYMYILDTLSSGMERYKLKIPG